VLPRWVHVVRLQADYNRLTDAVVALATQEMSTLRDP
jgi:hypothetical protein